MSNEKLNQIRESISDASLTLSQLGDDASHLSTLIAQKRLERLSDLEFAVLSGGAQDDYEELLKLRRKLASLRLRYTLLKRAGEHSQGCNVATELTIDQDPHPFDGKRAGNRRLTVKLENGVEVIYKIKDSDGN